MKKILGVSVLLAGMALLWTTSKPVLAEELAATPQSPVKSLSSGPRQAIEHLDEALLASMKSAKKIGYKGRYRQLAPVVDKVFDFSSIAAVSMGTYWTKLDPAQQSELVTTLRDYTIATYAFRFDNYSGEQFSIKSVQHLEPNVEVVYCTFTEASGEVHTFDYMMRSKAGSWRIINVVADGVSDLALKQAEFTHLMKLKGFGSLIDNLKNRITYMANTGQ